jgi:hypothetical protein
LWEYQVVSHNGLDRVGLVAHGRAVLVPEGEEQVGLKELLPLLYLGREMLQMEEAHEFAAQAGLPGEEAQLTEARQKVGERMHAVQDGWVGEHDADSCCRLAAARGASNRTGKDLAQESQHSLGMDYALHSGLSHDSCGGVFWCTRVDRCVPTPGDGEAHIFHICHRNHLAADLAHHHSQSGHVSLT